MRRLLRTMRGMALFGALWAALVVLRLVGRELALTAEERRVLLGRIEAFLVA